MDGRNVAMLMEGTLIRRHGFSADQCKNRCAYQHEDRFQQSPVAAHTALAVQVALVPQWMAA